MNPDTELAERFSGLPEAVQTYIVSDGLSRDVRSITSAFGLTPEVATAVENEIVMVILFITPEESLLENLTAKAGVDPAVANELRTTIDRVVFDKLVNMLPPTADVPEVPVSEDVAKRQQLADLAERFAAPVTPVVHSDPVTPLESAAERLASVPVAKPLSSASLTSMSTPVAENQLQPAVAAAAQNVPPAWTSGTPAANVQPVSTMGEDIQRIHGYGAYREQYPHLYTNEEASKAAIRSVAQDALLKRAPVVDTPNFNDQNPQ